MAEPMQVDANNNAGAVKVSSRTPYQKILSNALVELCKKSQAANHQPLQAATFRHAFSLPVISNFIASHYSVKRSVGNGRFRKYLNSAVQQLLRQHRLIQIKRSYRLSSRGLKQVRGLKRVLQIQNQKRQQAQNNQRVARANLVAKKRNARNANAAKGVKFAVLPVVPVVAVGRKQAPAISPKKRVSKKNQRVANAAVANVSDTGAAPIVKAIGSKFSHVWQFVENDGSWRNYEVAASDEVEDTYQKYLQNKGDSDVRSVKSGQWQYQVDFMAYKQTNIQHSNHTVRNIRRVAIAAN